MADVADRRLPGPRDWRCDLALHDPCEVHIRPRNDLIWHELTDDCVCGPEALQPSDDECGPVRWLYLHNALDGRERQQGGYSPTPSPVDSGGDPGAVAA